MSTMVLPATTASPPEEESFIEEVEKTEAPTKPCKPWFRWIPTSESLRQYYEARVLETMPVEFDLHHVDVTVPSATHRHETVNHRINTISVNPQNHATQPDKPHLLLLHGMGAGLGIWTLNMRELEKHYHVHAIDIIGFGGSSRPRFQTNNQEEIEKIFVDSIESWRVAKGIDQFHLLGHSFGGYIAGLYALHHPKNLNHIIFADPWGFTEAPPTFHEWVQSQSLPLRAIFNVVKRMPPLAILRASGPFGPSLVRRRKDIGAKVEGSMDKNHLFDYIYHSNAKRPSAELAFKKLCDEMPWAARPLGARMKNMHPDLPVTFLHGDESWMTQAGHSVLEERPVNTHVRVLSSAGHHVMWDNPIEFNQFVAEAKDIVNEPFVKEFEV